MNEGEGVGMLKKLLFTSLLALGLSACTSVEEKLEVQPEKLPLTLKDGKLTGEYIIAEGETPALFSVRKDQLGPLCRVRFDEGEQSNVAVTVPAGSKWLQVFGIDFQLPGKGGATLTTYDVNGAKVFFFLCDPVNTKQGTEWNGQLVSSGTHHFRILVTKDGQIFNVKSPGYLDGSWMTYSHCYEFSNQEGKLAIRNGWTEWIQTTVELPPYQPDPMTRFELNLPDIEKHLTAMQQKEGLFRCMTGADFKNFCDRAKGLKAGMSPDEVKTILGKPDRDVVTMAPKGPEGKRYRTLTYWITKKVQNGVNLYIDSALNLSFRTAEDGSEQLEQSY